MRKKLFIVLCLISSFISVYAQSYHTSGFKFYKKTKKVRIPFLSINNLIIIKISINGSPKYNFILDSGVRKTIIISLEPQESLQINQARKIKINGLGKGKAIDAFHSIGNSMNLSNKVIGINQELIILLDDIFHLKSQLGIPIHGIIGYDLLRHFVTKINYETLTITFYTPEEFIYKRTMGQKLTMKIFSKKPYIIGQTEACNDSSKDVKLLIDSGGSMPIWLYVNTKNGICLPQKHIRAKLGEGLNGKIEGLVGRISYLQIGKVKFINPICNFPDSSSIYNVIAMDKRNGSIGTDILRRFTFYLDYPHHEFIFKKNTNFHEAFNYNMSGLEILKPYPKLPIYTIGNVVKNSPAGIAGLKINDQILFMNGKIALKLSLDEINFILHTHDNKKIRMVVQRGEKEIKVVFRLKKII